jgi:hypothetical protein
MIKRLMRIAILTSTAALLIPAAARAADPVFCAGYADAAMNQIRAALSNPNCAGGAHGPRWIMERHVHFDWCLTVPAPFAASEREARTEFLRGCRG